MPQTKLWTSFWLCGALSFIFSLPSSARSTSVVGWTQRSCTGIHKLVQYSWRHLPMFRLRPQRRVGGCSSSVRKVCSSPSNVTTLSRMTSMSSATDCSSANSWSHSTFFAARALECYVCVVSFSTFISAVDCLGLSMGWHCRRKETCKCSFTCGSNGRFCNDWRTCVSTCKESVTGFWSSFLFFPLVFVGTWGTRTMGQPTPILSALCSVKPIARVSDMVTILVLGKVVLLQPSNLRRVSLHCSNAPRPVLYPHRKQWTLPGRTFFAPHARGNPTRPCHV